MKKLIVLLLFPLVSFSQTYEDIISIDSKEQFIRIGIENDYEVIENNNNSVKLALEPIKNKKKETIAKGFANYEDYKELFIAPMYNVLINKSLDVKYLLLEQNQTLFSGTPTEYEQLKNIFKTDIS